VDLNGGKEPACMGLGLGLGERRGKAGSD
jgi:hypothetical protein